MDFDPSDRDFEVLERRDLLKATGALGIGTSLKKELRLEQFNDLKQTKPFKIEWQKKYDLQNNDEFVSIINVSDGYLVVGLSSDTDGDDGLLVKVDKQGNEQWNKTYGGKHNNKFHSVIEVSDGYLAAGKYESSNSDGSYGWLVKVDEQGSEQWNKTYGGKHNNKFHSVIEVSDGYLAAGKYESSADPGDAWLLKVDKQGNKQWQQTYGGPNNIDKFHSVIEVSNGYLAAGKYESPNSDGSNGWLVKVDEQSNEQWKKTYGGKYYDAFFTVIEVSEGYLAAGRRSSSRSDTSSSGSDTRHGWLLKMDEQGNEQWNKTYGGKYADRFYSVIEVNDGYLTAGENITPNSSIGDGWLVKVDKQGSEQWEKTYGGKYYDAFSTLTEASDGYLVAGQTVSSSSGNGNGWLVKLSNKGNSTERNNSNGKNTKQNQGSELPGFGVTAALTGLGIGAYKYLNRSEKESQQNDKSEKG